MCPQVTVNQSCYKICQRCFGIVDKILIGSLYYGFELDNTVMFFYRKVLIT